MTTIRTGVSLTVLAVALLATLGLASASAEWNLLLDARPGTLVVSKSSDLKALGPDEFNPGTVTIIEEAGTLNTIPTIRLGGGYDTPSWYFNGVGLVGVVVNSRFNTITYGADAAAQYKYRKNVMVGPHLSYLFLPEPSWSGDAEVTFSDSYAFLPGVQFSVGYDVLFVFSVDYLMAQPFDVTAEAPWRLDDDQVDISGLMFQFGMQGKF
jgi:hypothetical protein